MKIAVGAAPASALGYIEERVGVVLTRNARGVMAVKDGRIVGMVAYDGWTDNAVQVHMAVEFTMVWRALLRPAFRYGFEHRTLLLGGIRASNKKSLSTALNMGFREIARVRDGFSVGDDMVLIEMRREECQWIGD